MTPRRPSKTTRLPRLPSRRSAPHRCTTQRPPGQKAVISRGSGEQPFVVTTATKATHVELSEKGGLAAVGVALVPLALAALLLWTRFG